MIIESMAELFRIVGIVNVVCIGTIVGGNMVLVLDLIMSLFMIKIRKKALQIGDKKNLDTRRKEEYKQIINKSLLCIKNGNFLLPLFLFGLFLLFRLLDLL